MPLPVALGGGTFVKAMVTWFVVNVACKLVFRVLASLGVGVIAYVGGDFLFSYLETQLQTSVAGLPVELKGVLDATNADKYISIVFSALTYRKLLDISRGAIGYRGKPTQSPC